jgi:N-acylglucosamine 2-epimerase
MPHELNVKELKEFYSKELFEKIMPFWLKNSIDKENGGFFTCFSNDLKQLVSTDIYIWQQGRIVWVLSRLYNQFTSIDQEERDQYLELARLGAEFMMKHSRLDNGNCVMVTDRLGKPIMPPGADRYDTSIYADCFVIYGLAEYARAAGDRQSLDFAIDLYRSVRERFENGDWCAAPYPIPDGYKMHGPSMIMLETAKELADNASHFDKSIAEELRKDCAPYVDEIMNNHLQPDNLVREFILNNNSTADNILGQYINPGHTIESMWFVIHYALTINDTALIQKAAGVVYTTFETGWDDEYGGLLAFCDKDGGKPHGKIPPEIENELMPYKIQEDWDMKLWWVHGEALYSLLLCYKLTGDKKLLEQFKRVHDYTFKTFPHPDPEIGEWIQIRDRKGNPSDRITAIPVKDGFHVPRNLMLVLKCLETMNNL